MRGEGEWEKRWGISISSNSNNTCRVGREVGVGVGALVGSTVLKAASMAASMIASWKEGRKRERGERG